MKITQSPFGLTTSGQEIFKFVLENPGKLSVEVLTYGATIQKLYVPNESHEKVDVVLGFETIQEYEAAHPYVGSFIGRNANRLKREVLINGDKVVLPVNEGQNQLHGGVDGFHKRVWNAVVENDSLVLSLYSQDGDEGFPGNLKVQTIFKIVGSRLEMQLKAITDQPTIVNFTRHEYFNLRSGTKKTITDHKLQVHATSFTVLDEDKIATGAFQQVAGTAYDFMSPRVIGDYRKGFDLNYVLDKTAGTLSLAAQAWAPDSAITMKIYCTQPGLQFFSASSVVLASGKNDFKEVVSPGFCLEPQYFPNAPSHSHFPSTVLLPSEVYEEQIVYDFE